MTYVISILFIVLIGLLYFVGRRATSAEEEAQKEREKNQRRAWDEYRRGRDAGLEASREDYESKKDKFINLFDDDSDDGPGGTA